MLGECLCFGWRHARFRRAYWLVYDCLRGHDARTIPPLYPVIFRQSPPTTCRAWPASSMPVCTWLICDSISVAGFAGMAGDVLDHALDFRRRARGALGRFAHFVGHHGKPLPDSPARAASMAAFSAKRLVCSAISSMMLTIEPICADMASSSPPRARRLAGVRTPCPLLPCRASIAYGLALVCWPKALDRSKSCRWRARNRPMLPEVCPSTAPWIGWGWFWLAAEAPISWVAPDRGAGRLQISGLCSGSAPPSGAGLAAWLQRGPTGLPVGARWSVAQVASSNARAPAPPPAPARRPAGQQMPVPAPRFSAAMAWQTAAWFDQLVPAHKIIHRGRRQAASCILGQNWWRFTAKGWPSGLSPRSSPPFRCSAHRNCFRAWPPLKPACFIRLQQRRL